MAHTSVTKTHSQNTGAANTFSYSGSFDVFKGTEVVALLDNIALTYTASTINESASPREYTVDTAAKTIHIGGANLSSGTIIIRPNTDMGDPTPRADYTPGASITSADLNNNQLQLMRKAMEYDETKMSTTGDTMTGHLTMGEDTKIIFEGATDDGFETTLTVADPSGSDKTITLPNVTGTVVTTGDTGTVTATMLAANSVDSSELVDGSIDASHIASGAVTTAKLGADAVDGTKLADNAVDSEHYTDGSIDTVHIAADAITGAKIADDAVDSEHYTDGSIDTAHIADLNVTTAKIAADAVTGAKIADDAIDSEHYTDESIDTAHIGGTQVTAAKLASNSVTTSKITDANVTTLKIADSNVTLGKLHSDLKQTSVSDSDTQLPTSGAVVDYVTAQLLPFGGFEAIATEVLFPNTQPASGVVISIADAGGVVVNGSGTSTTGRTVGGSTVTINNFASNFNSSTIDAGVHLLVSSTGSSQTYNYHKATLKEADLLSLSNDINDFAARYRVQSGEPSSSLDAGDLTFDTAAGKMKVYDGGSWNEVASTGDFKFLVMTNAGTTNAATLNGSNVTFDLKESSTGGVAATIKNAAQLMVSVNGVIQKPNSGTNTSGLDGFVMTDADTIKFCDAPESGDEIFIIQSGSAVAIPTPGDGTVSAAKIASGAVETAKIADGAVTTAKLASDVVTGAKIADDAINSEHYTDGSIDTAHIAADQITSALIADDAVGAEHIEQLDADLSFADSAKAKFGASNDLELSSGGTGGLIKTTTGSLTIATASLHINNAADTEQCIHTTENGSVELFYNDSKKFETYSSGVKTYGGFLRIVGDEGGTAELNLYADEGDDAYDVWQVKAGGASDFYIAGWNGGSYETAIKATGNGAVEAYYNNSKKLETSSDGIAVTGDVTITNTGSNPQLALIAAANGTAEIQFGDANDAVRGNIIYACGTAGDKLQFNGYNNTERFNVDSSGNLNIPNDSGKFRLGTGADLEIFHDGSDSTISNATGQFTIRGDTLVLAATSAYEKYLTGTYNGAVELYHNNIKTFETNANGAKIFGPEGGSADLYMWADEGDDNADQWRLQATTGGEFTLKNNASGSLETNLKAVGDGTIELYHNNAKKLETTAYGMLHQGGAVAASTGYFKVNDDGHFYAGDDEDLWIYSNSSNSWFKQNTAGNMYFKAYEGQSIRLLDHDSSEMLKATDKSHVELYSNTVKTFSTTTNGAIVWGSEGNNASLHFHADEGDDWADYWNFNAKTDGSFELQCRNDSSAFEDVLKADRNGKVALYYDNTKRFETTSTGSLVSGKLQVTTTSTNTVAATFKNTGDGSDGTEIQFTNDSASPADGDQTAYLQFNGNDDNGNGTIYNAIIGYTDDVTSGTTDGSLKFYCRSNGSFTQRLLIAADGTFTGSGSNDISDERLKDNIATVVDPIAKIKALKGRTFTWKPEANLPEGTKYGFIAQEVEAVVSDLVDNKHGLRQFDKDNNLIPQDEKAKINQDEGTTESKSVHATGVVPILVEALKEALTKIETLETKVAALEAK